MYHIGIDLGGTNIAAGLVDVQGRILRRGSVPTRREREYPEIVRDMAMLSLKLVKDAGLDIKQIRSIGVGAPGTPDCINGILVYANNLKFRNVPIRSELRKYIDLPVYLDNDANAAALAESVAGAAKGTADSVTVTLGTGVGGGVVIGGKVYSGFNNAASEMGHITIMMDGEPCTCGRRGCWEAYASATALIEQTRKAALNDPGSIIHRLAGGNLDAVDAKLPFDAAKQGDTTAAAVVGRYVAYVAEGLTNIVNALCPEIIVIGGGVSMEGEYLLKPLREIVRRDTYCKEAAQTRIEAALMGNDAGIVGAAMLGLQGDRLQ